MKTAKAEGERCVLFGVEDIPNVGEVSDELLEDINSELIRWFNYEVAQAGNTITSCNVKGTPYITFMIGFPPHKLQGALALFKSDIQEEINKTGIISVRLKPSISAYDPSGFIYKGQFYVLRARLVSY